ncbi:unnamed protein product, partial [Rotaria magnacalcarata]
MSGLTSAFARYSEEVTASPLTDTVLSASRKRKRVSMTTSNGHSNGNQTNKTRSKSLEPL